jgi:hypothetical protein
MRRLLAALCLAIAPGSATWGADLQEAEALYEQGAMQEAAKLGAEVGGADGLTLAAKATLVEAIYQAPADAKPALLDEAAGYAKAALALEPDDVDAMIDLALALGHKADLAGPISAHLNGYATEGRALLDKALTLDPENAWAHGLLGMWHLQVVRHASDGLAAELYGASRAAGLDHCERAEALGPEDLALKYGCALTMLELDGQRYGQRAAQALEEVSRMPAQDAAEELVRADAARLLAELEINAVRPADPDG